MKLRQGAMCDQGTLVAAFTSGQRCVEAVAAPATAARVADPAQMQLLFAITECI
jgi:hypothetical protein